MFEVKNGSGKLTKNQQGSGMFDMSNPANTNGGLGGGLIKPSGATQGQFEVATKTARGTQFGGNGAQHSATFWLLRY